MNIILLPGNNSKNRAWVQRMTNLLVGSSHVVIPIFYEHWEKEKGSIDFELELAALVSRAPKEYIIIGKSVGALLAIYGVYRNLLNPERCILAGLPLKWIQENNFDLNKYLSSYSVSTIVAQHSFDPTASYKEIYNLFEGHSNVLVKELPGDSHQYSEEEIMLYL